MILNPRPLTKQLLTMVLGVSKSTLNRRINSIKSEILSIDPKYNDSNQIIRKAVFIYICDDFGLDRETVLFRIKQFVPEYKDFDLSIIGGIYGLKNEKE